MHNKIKTLLAAATCALAIPATAEAGSYNVSSCDSAGGAQNAWSPQSTHFQMTAFSVCPSLGDWGRGIIARNGIASNTLVIPSSGAARQFFTAPDGTGITNVRFSGQLYRAPGQRWTVGLSNGTDIFVGIGANTTWGFMLHPTDHDVPIPGNQTVYWEVACYAPSGCDAKSTGDAQTHYVRAGIWIHSTVVTIHDPTAPNVAWSGSLLSGVWVRGDQSFHWDSNDNSGISSVNATVSGRSIASQNPGCDYSHPRPCPFSQPGATTVSTAGWPDGGHHVRIEVRDASGNVNHIDGAAYIDNNAPARVTAPAVEGGEGWRASNSFKVNWANPGGQHAPISTRHYKLCPTDGGACHTGSQPGGQSDITLTVPRPGAWRTQIWLQDSAGNVDPSTASDPVTLRFDDSTPAQTTIATPDGWIGDSQAQGLDTTLTLQLGAASPPSGIAGYSVTTDGSDPDATIDTDSSWTTGQLPEGSPTLKARAVSGSGRPGPIAARTLQVDRTTPTADATALPDAGTWHDQPVTVELKGADKGSGLAAIHWQLDNTTGQQAAGERASVTISDDGKHTLTWESVDRAGNRSRARQAVIRIDRSGPDSVTIQPTDPKNPRQVVAEAIDRGSGINAGIIQIRPTGGAWRDLDTTLDETRTRLTAQLNDLELADGNYQLRATATDNIGNSRTGAPSAIELPVRASSQLKLTAAPTTARSVRGQVTGSTDRPLTSATVTVLTKPRTEKTWQRETTIRTGKDGRFRYRVRSGPTRTIRFIYTGTDTIRPASADQTIHVRARTTIRASRRRASLGQTIVFSGRLKGQPIPRDGKVLELQAYDAGRWRSFPRVVTTARDGRWTSKLRFERTRGVYTYRIRARVFRDGSYPYETGVSRTVRVTVRGR